MGYISVRNAHKEFMKDGEPLTILEDINLDIEKGEFICLLGPSGSGKSTLLNAIAGFELVTSGSITIDGEEVKAPQLRYVTVFQNYGLLPWRTVESNIELGLESKRFLKKSVLLLSINTLKWWASIMLAIAILQNYLGACNNGYPLLELWLKILKFSFVMNQRGALDYQTGKQVLKILQDMSRKKGATVIIVTHNASLAPIADRVIQMHDASVKSVVLNPQPQDIDDLEY